MKTAVLTVLFAHSSFCAWSPIQSAEWEDSECRIPSSNLLKHKYNVLQLLQQPIFRINSCGVRYLWY
jgi:hypothetical protein